MIDLESFKTDVSEEVSTILDSSFDINSTETDYVPHSSDGAITFPNLDDKYQNVKVLETTVLYVDMRRSTELSLKYRRQTVARLYSAFIRAMTRCAGMFGGEVRGIIGDRVMILFDKAHCFTEAIDTAVLINSVCQYIINIHFRQEEVSFGIGIDYGRMLATKTGIRRHGAAQGSYHSLVWLGRPANIASKLTDHANKPEEAINIIRMKVSYTSWDGTLTSRIESPHEFVQKFTHNPIRHLMVPQDSTFHSFTTFTERFVTAGASPPILMSKCVLDGFRAARPNAVEIEKGWFYRVSRSIPNVAEDVYGGDVIFEPIRGW